MQSLFITFDLLLLFEYCYICHFVSMSVMYLSVSVYTGTTMEISACTFWCHPYI